MSIEIALNFLLLTYFTVKEFLLIVTHCNFFAGKSMSALSIEP